jgi:hypothetical protein
LTQVARYMYQVPLRLFKHLNNIAIITATVWETVMMILLMGRNYHAHRWAGFIWHVIPAKFHEDWNRRSSNSRVLRQKFQWL